MKDQWIIVWGNPMDGLTFQGPFESVDDASAYVEDLEAWYIARLMAVES